MAHVYTEEQNYVDIANAIREKNGTDNTYAPSEMADAIKDINTTLQETTLLIDHNGTYEITPTDGAYGLSKVNVSTNIDMTFINLYMEKLTLGLNRAVADGYLSENRKQQIIEFFIERGGGSDYHYWDDNYIAFNPLTTTIEGRYGVVVYTGGIEYCNAPNIQADVIISLGYGISNAYEFISPCFLIVLINAISAYILSAVFMGNMLLEKVIGQIQLLPRDYDASSFLAFSNIGIMPTINIVENAKIISFSRFAFNNKKIKYIQLSVPIQKCYFELSFAGCLSLETIDIIGHTNYLYRTFYNAQKLKSVKQISLLDNISTNYAFRYCHALEEIELTNWHTLSLSFEHSPNLSIESINRLIENCDKDGGTQVARTLTLHATAGARWADETQNPRYTELLTKANQCLIQIIY